MVKNLPANAGDTALIPGSGRSPGEGHAIDSSILTWEIPCTKELVYLPSVGLKRVRQYLATKQQ